jgi:hypothetical protein
MKPSAMVTVIFLSLVSLAHLLRFALQVNVTVKTWIVPMWLSLVAFLAVGALALWLWREESA